MATERPNIGQSPKEVLDAYDAILQGGESRTGTLVQYMSACAELGKVVDVKSLQELYKNERKKNEKLLKRIAILEFKLEELGITI